MEKILTTTIVLNYNSSEESIRLFKDLKKNHPDELKILVIDNNSNSAEKSKLVANIPAENLIFNSKNLGYAGGNNVGIQIALNKGANYIWILNPDIRIQKNSLPILKETLIAYPKIAAVGPRINYRIKNDKIFSDGGIYLKDEKCSTFHKNQNDHNSLHKSKIDFDIDYVDGSCILLNAEALRDLGNFPEEYFLYFEETDWCMKAKSQGYKLCVNSNARVFNLDSEKGKVFHFYMMRNRLLFAKKYHPDLKLVKNYYLKTLLNEFLMRFKGEYLKPFYVSRVRGFLSGYLKTM